MLNTVCVHVYNQTPIKRLKTKTPYEALNRDKPDISHLRILGCGAYVFLHEDMWQDVLLPHAKLMTFIGFTGGVKGSKFMRNTNTIFHPTKAVFDENMYPQCPDGSCVNIPAIETSVLPPPDSYLDRDNNIPLEDGDQPPPPPLPVEIDPIWRPQGTSWLYVPDTLNGSGGFDSQPPSLPLSPGLSYHTPRTPSSRHRSVTPSHYSSGNAGSCHNSSGNTSARSQTLTEPDPSASVTEVSQSQPIFTDTDLGSRWEYEVVMSDGTTQHRPVSPPTASKLMIPITVADGTIRHRPASPPTVSRVMAHRQTLESPLAPRSTAILETEIASYPQEWHDGACSRKYSFIPSYQGWRHDNLLELARTEHAGPSRLAEWPLSPVPGHSTRAEPIEQPAFEVP